MQHLKIYRRLTNREREEISRGLAAGAPQVEIARTIHRHPSTISREVKRGSGRMARSEYRAFAAGRKAAVRASSRRLGKSRLTQEARLRRYVIAGLQREWSPREIQERLGKEDPPGM